MSPHPLGLEIEGLRPGMPDDEVIERITLDVLNPIPREQISLNPVEYEIVVNKISAILREGSFALARTSGSPIVTECGEYMLALFDKEGHAAYVTTGVLPHLAGTEGAIKWIIYQYSSSPGIYPGDQFLINDPYIIGAHTNDLLITKPIFWKDDLVAWVASLTHTVEVGAMEPGATAHSTDIFQEGLRIPGMKIIEKSEPSNPVFKLLERGVRDPQLLTLDNIAKIASNNVVSARIEDLLRQRGPDFLKQVLRKMIYEGEDKSRERIQAIPDGVWRSITYGDFDGLKRSLFKISVTCEKKEGQIFLDFTGTSAQNPGPINSSLPGSIGAIFSVFVSTIFWDLIWNRGILAPVKITIPKGTVINPYYPCPVNASPPTASALLAGAVTKVVSRMNMAAGFTEEVCAPWLSNWNGVFMGGINQHQRLQGTITMDANGGGTGATASLDGDDTAAFILAPGALMADVESYEAKNPLLYLFRRQREDSGGHGKFRGGCGGEAAVLIHNTHTYRLGFRGVGKYIAATSGIYGGYPADSINNGFIFNAGPRILHPLEFGKIKSFENLERYGDFKEMTPMAASTPVQDGDLYYLRWSGGGGYGDPMERDPNLVAIDVRERKISLELAERVYGVILTPSDFMVDKKGTESRRLEILKERKKMWKNPERKAPFSEAATGYGSEKKRRIRIHESLVVEMNSEGRLAEIKCLKCHVVLCHSSQNYKDYVPYIDRDPKWMKHLLIDPELMIYREYYCPGCAILLEVDPIPSGEIPIWDIKLS
jgi:N-methylhydantoinase B